MTPTDHSSEPTILIGTVALEPNRWGQIHPDRRPTLALSTVMARLHEAGFDGLELWDGHVLGASDAETEALTGSQPSVTIFNSYADFDADDPTSRHQAERWITELGCAGVKYNVGNDPGALDAYAARIGEWVDRLAGVRLLCECHEAISVAEDPDVAARLFDRAGPADRVQAIVHLGDEDEDLTRRRFDAYGDRITHVHVNFLLQQAPPLHVVADQVRARVEMLQSLGFAGSWTIEFTNGLFTDDRPEHLVGSAITDLAFLREVLR